MSINPDGVIRFDSLRGILPERYRLIEISKSQLSKVNKKRDYRAFVWAFYEIYEIIDRIWRMERAETLEDETGSKSSWNRFNVHRLEVEVF